MPTYNGQYTQSIAGSRSENSAVTFGADISQAPVYLDVDVIPSHSFARLMLALGRVVRMKDTGVQKDHSAYQAWVKGEYAKVFFNSLKLVAGSVFLCLAVSLAAGFSLAKLNPKGSAIIAVYLLVGISIPAQLYIVPLFLLWKEIHLLNTHIGLIIIYTALNAPFATFLIRSYMIRLPDELFEAARLDGANTFQLFFRVALPLSWPVILTSGLIIALSLIHI